MNTELPTSVVGLSSLITEAYVSTLKADQQGILEYLRILKEMEQMPPLVFSFVDDMGRRQSLQVPVMTLVPLSLLHIQEAEFEYKCQLSITSQSKSKSDEPRLKPAERDAVDQEERALHLLPQGEISQTTYAYDAERGESCNLDEVAIYQSLSNPRDILFKVIQDKSTGKPLETLCVSDPTRLCRTKRFVLLTLGPGRPYTMLWVKPLVSKPVKRGLPRRRSRGSSIASKNVDWSNYRLLITLYADNHIHYNGRLYKVDPSGEQSIRIDQRFLHRHALFSHRHLRSRLQISKNVTAVERPPQVQTIITTTESSSNSNENSNITIKIKLGQTAIPGGLADVLRVLNNESRLSPEHVSITSPQR